MYRTPPVRRISSSNPNIFSSVQAENNASPSNKILSSSKTFVREKSINENAAESPFFRGFSGPIENMPVTSFVRSGSQHPVVQEYPSHSHDNKDIQSVPNEYNYTASQMSAKSNANKSAASKSHSSKFNGSQTSTATRKMLEIQLNYARKRKQENMQILDLEEALEIAKANENSNSTIGLAVSRTREPTIPERTARVQNWINDNNSYDVFSNGDINDETTQQLLNFSETRPRLREHSDIGNPSNKVPNFSHQDGNVQPQLHTPVVIDSGRHFHHADFKKEAQTNDHQDFQYNPKRNHYVPSIENSSRNYGCMPSDNQHKSLHHMDNWYARQSVPKDLPPFSGDPLEWPLFITTFQNSTRICKLSLYENQLRLQKSLRGKAKEAVQSLLILPDNVNRVINVLENRFGRAEYVIHLLLDKVKQFPIVQENRIDLLVNFFDILSNLVYTLEVYNQIDHIRNPVLFREILNKLPMGQRISFVEFHNKNKSDNPPIIDLHKWLNDKVNAASFLIIPSSDDKCKSLTKVSKHKGKDNMTFTTTENVTSNVCLCCNELNHSLSQCSKFKNFELNKRWDIITKNRLCISCLKPKHNIKACRNKKNCTFENCSMPHHPLLHKIQKTVESRSEKNIESNCHVLETNQVLLKIIPIELSGPKGTLTTYALLDDASTVSIIEKNVADKLGLDGPINPLRIKWTNEQVNEENDSKSISIVVRGINCANKFTLRRVKTMTSLSLPTQSVNIHSMLEKYPYMSQFSGLSYVNAKPTILIGQDNWPVIATRRIASGYWNGPTASKTLLGWVVHGNVDCNEFSLNMENVFCHVYDNENCKSSDDLTVLENLIKEQWCFDVSMVSNSEYGLSIDDKRSLEILKKTVRRVDENKFESGLLWKKDDDILPESYSNALKRLQHLERKMDKNSNFAKLYCEKMKENIEKGYLRKVITSELDNNNAKVWYLPHFGVVNLNKPDKLRIVFDAAAKSNGRCLNDFLLTGPDFYKSLPAILLNFRINKIAFVADIKEMFLQVQIRDNDKCAQRLLWRGMNRNKEPDVFEIQVVFFGATCSPCIAQEVKNANAREFLDEYPFACRDIIESHYMDDYLGGCRTIEDAVKLINEIIYVHSKAGFSICNWISNSPEVISYIEPNLRAKTDNAISLDSQNAEERILGMWWNYKFDSFSYQFKFNKINPNTLRIEHRPTKREVLRIIMSIFDPLGLISNFLIVGKILMQNIWQSGIQWDDPISDTDFIVWKSWRSNFDIISKVKIPRLLTTFEIDNCSSIQLHVFCDASDAAYAALAYVRFQSDSGIQCVLINAKSRVASLKPTSIPRLELQGALVAARLGSNLKQILNFKLDRVVYWCDSKTVLYWIKSNSRRFKTYVSQRLGEIHELSNPKDWKYVPSKLNVADDATKFKVLDFSEESVWLYGPKFVYKNEKEWPADNFAITDDEIQTSEDLKVSYTLVIQNDSNILINPERFSKWNKLKRSMAWVIRAVKRFKECILKGDKIPISKSASFELDIHEIDKAENYLLKQSQQNSFSKDFSLLKSGNDVAHDSSLKSFKCFMGDDDLIRVTGRLENASELNYDTKHPIILNPKDEITKLIICYFHEKNNHLGTETIISNIRQKFWIINLRNSVKGIARQCQFCKIKKSKPQVQIMGQLPQCRVQTLQRPFAKCGVDFFGPYNVLVNRHCEKRYGVLFTCMNIRAIHLEIAVDLSCSSFIHVLRQFASRRCYPLELFSDNGSNFRCANREISEALKEWNQDEIQSFCTTNNCQWIFNPPAAPHMGGVWERQIQSVKRHLDYVLKERNPKEFVLRTLFCEVEDIVNNRPITFNSSDSQDNTPLTPNNFLKSFQFVNPQICKSDDYDLRLLSHWRAVQRLTDIFWSNWVNDFIPTLICSKKWNKEKINLCVNDIVLVVDPDGPRNSWPIGKIVKTCLAKDGFVRIVDVKTKSGIYRRPISKIIKLDVFKESNSL